MTKPVLVLRTEKNLALTYEEHDQNFKNLRDATHNYTVGSNTAQVDLNSALTFVAGDNISLSLNTTSKELTITSADFVESVSGTSGRISSTGGLTPVIDLVTTSVTPGTYNNASIVVDAYGRITSASGGSADLITDTSPQLGGDLDVNGKSIVSVSNGNITLAPHGTGKVIVNGNLQIDGTTTTVNSTTVTIDDPVFTIGGDTAPTITDTKDRGIEFRYSVEVPNRTPKVVTNTATYSSSTYKFGTQSFSFGSVTNGYLTSPSNSGFAFGTGNFTIEYWINHYNISGTQSHIDMRTAATQVVPRLYTSVGQLFYYVNGANRITGPSLNIGSWYHIALSRSSGVTKLFVNGSQVGSSYTDTNNYVQSYFVAGIYAVDLTSDLGAYVDEIRISNTARYTTNFTAPTAPFTDDANTVLLLHGDGDAVDAVATTQTPKVGFFGYDVSAGTFAFIPDATNTSEVFTGTAGVLTGDLIGNVTGNVTGNVSGTAGSLATGRTISITGDLTYTSESFNGSANVTGTGTLATSGVTAGTYSYPTITVDAKGRITSASSNTVSTNTISQLNTSVTATDTGTNGLINLSADGSTTRNLTVTTDGLVKYAEKIYFAGNAGVTLDRDNGPIQRVNAVNNFSLSLPVNMVEGQTMTLIIQQDATGGRTMSSSLLFAGGNKTLSTTPNAIDIVTIMRTPVGTLCNLVKGYV